NPKSKNGTHHVMRAGLERGNTHTRPCASIHGWERTNTGSDPRPGEKFTPPRNCHPREPRKTGSPSSRCHEWNPFALRYRRAVCKFPAPFMVRYLTTNGKRFRLTWSGEPRRKWFFEVPCRRGGSPDWPGRARTNHVLRHGRSGLPPLLQRRSNGSRGFRGSHRGKTTDPARRATP